MPVRKARRAGGVSPLIPAPGQPRGPGIRGLTPPARRKQDDRWLDHLNALSHSSKPFLCFSIVLAGPVTRMKYGPLGLSNTTPTSLKSFFSVTGALGSNGGVRSL